MTSLVTKLIPILRVKDADAERRFYQTFGLRTTYEGPEYPGFIAVGTDTVEFGLSTRPDADASAADSVVQWQLEVSDVDEVIAACRSAGLDYEVVEEAPAEDWRYRVVKVRSPNGYEVWFEGDTE